uniref:Uncharacterized protein n=1 Tax=Physcomitrium patens TaxID=3218 RepID=A0A2K1L1Q0_PHYPA|nr:hypothetical protein PHYPA_002746 [Physcomitrium patens]
MDYSHTFPCRIFFVEYRRQHRCHRSGFHHHVLLRLSGPLAPVMCGSLRMILFAFQLILEIRQKAIATWVWSRPCSQAPSQAPSCRKDPRCIHSDRAKKNLNEKIACGDCRSSPPANLPHR